VYYLTALYYFISLLISINYFAFFVFLQETEKLASFVWTVVITKTWQIIRRLLERVEHRIMRMTPHYKHIPYKDSLAQLGLLALQPRQLHGDLIEVFKTINRVHNSMSRIGSIGINCLKML